MTVLFLIFRQHVQFLIFWGFQSYCWNKRHIAIKNEKEDRRAGLKKSRDGLCCAIKEK
jgi:hypothetical protein